MSKNPKPHLPLQERFPIPRPLAKSLDLLILFLLLSLLLCRLSSFNSKRDSTLILIIAFLCESWFTFVWFLNVNAKWSSVRYKTYPQRLTQRFEELPAVDMFVTTADATLEPPIITVNTVLSLLAVDYPSNRLACYVSDDGCSPLTYYALSQASEFAKLWVPFCKRHNVQARAPFMYFSTEPPQAEQSSEEFFKDWKQMKGEYDELCRKIEGAAQNYVPFHMKDELEEFSGVDRRNHPSIIKVIRENRGEDEDVPHLIYVAREKKPKHHHHFKAGAMNVLTRVSGVMTNAPFMLNVDCDMLANNPEVILHGMCLLLGFENEISSGYVQAPQNFHDGLKDDPFGNQLVAIQNTIGYGFGGIQGSIYQGTGCFHRRKIIYGSSPTMGETNGYMNTCGDKLPYEQHQRTYGSSRELIESANEITSNKSLEFPTRSDLSSRISEAKQISSCTYEFNTKWGHEIGWLYGSITEDVLVGLRIQSKGWKSVYLTRDPPAFCGSVPTGGPASLAQYKRWSIGLLEILIGPNSPIRYTLYSHLRFRQCLAYLMLNIWALRSIVELSYSLLPAYCLITNSTFLPKASSPEFIILLAIFCVFNIYTLGEYLQCGLSARAWWNNQRMSRITCATAFLFGFLSVVLKLLGLSEMIFEVTRKDQNNSGEVANAEPGRFTFDSSPFFVPGTALVMVHIAALGVGAVKLVGGGGICLGIGEFVCSAWVLLSFWPFVRGLFGKGSYGIPWAVIWKALVLGSIFLQLCGLGRRA